MTIKKRPTTRSPSPADDFVLGVPDAACLPPKKILQGKQTQISLAMPPNLLMRVDEAARKLSLTRAGFIKLALSRQIEQEGA